MGSNRPCDRVEDQRTLARMQKRYLTPFIGPKPPNKGGKIARELVPVINRLSLGFFAAPQAPPLRM